MSQPRGPDPRPDQHAGTGQDTEANRYIRSPGWPTSVGAAMMLLASALTIILTSNSLTFFVAQAAALGLLLALIGLVIGSEILIAVAALPMLGSVLIGAGDGGSGWGRALIIGCLLFVSTEAAWSALEQRAGAGWTTAIAVQRGREVATVVATSLGVGLAAIGLTSLAPARTLFVRGMIAAAILLTLIAAIRQLRATGPVPGKSRP